MPASCCTTANHRHLPRIVGKKPMPIRRPRRGLNQERTHVPDPSSFIGGRWFGAEGATVLRSAVNGRPVASTHAEAIDFGEALQHARTVGLANLLAMDFQQRAQRLRALAKYLAEHKEELYAVSAHTGATRADSWVDIEGGAGTLAAYAGIGGNELPSGNLVHEGPAMPLGKKGGFAGTHILVPRRGVAVHINAFNFPVWGLLEKVGAELPGGHALHRQAATSTSYLTEALCADAPLGASCPKAACSWDRQHRRPARPARRHGRRDLHRLGRHRGQAARASEHRAPVDPVQCRGRLAQLRDPGPDVTPDDEEFDLFVKEVAREMTVKSGQKCTAIRRAIVPRQHIDAVAEEAARAAGQDRGRRPGARGRAHGGAGLARQQARRRRSQVQPADRQGPSWLYGVARQASRRRGVGVAKVAFFAPTLLLARDPLCRRRGARHRGVRPVRHR
jgi:oxepin-CoA hydrolase/3-oxo-5,6-dehydrosuberyl-CoA semialdehyde dehydrogenase